ncbi:MAG: 4-alpha-glucanotransferase [Nocardioidaceae bacterium]
MTTDDVSSWPALEELAHRYGLSTDYWDWQGRHVPVPIATATAVLAAFGVDATTDESVRAALSAVDQAAWRRMLPAVVVQREGSPAEVLVHVRHGDPLEVHLVTEDGATFATLQQEHNVAPHQVDGELVGEARFALPAELPTGYHRLHARSGDRSASALVVVAPQRLELPAALGPQAWGVMTQLYSVRSRASWGLGDFHDLRDLATWAAGVGAEFVLVNPLHAAQPVPPIENSPYLPTTRRFVSPLYIRVEDIPESSSLAATPQAIVDKYAAQAHALDDSSGLLDRQAAWAAKLGALDAVFAGGRTPARQAAFHAFCEREGEPLTEFATWCALVEHLGAPAGWPAWAHDRDAQEVEELVDDLSDRVDFFRWLQWVCDQQLDAAQQAAVGAGMSVGVVTDLAVGVHPEGADVWTLGSALATGVSVGAPPDAFNQIGQNWSQPPWRPDRLAEIGYAPYIAMLRTVLRHAGALRIDHVMGLFRLWCIPLGHQPSEGAYLRYDHEAMVSILLLEAQRAGAFVIGEDLGVVEPFVRDYLASRGILGTSILWFEVEDGAPRPPESYRELCLATVTTHDLPPTAGYLAGDHVRLREELGLLTRPVEDELAFAAHERDAFLGLLRERGLVADGATEQETVEALHLLLTETPSRLVGVMLSDLVGDRRTQNQPGTDKEYPNWRIPLSRPDGTPILLEDLPADARAASLATRLAAAMRVHRGH